MPASGLTALIVLVPALRGRAEQAVCMLAPGNDSSEVARDG